MFGLPAQGSNRRQRHGGTRLKALIDVVARHAQHQHKLPAARLYALLDGALYRLHAGASLQPCAGFYPLFADTQGAPLAHAGPWLVDAEQAGQEFIEQLAALEVSVRPSHLPTESISP